VAARRQTAVEAAPDKLDVEEFLRHPRPTRAQRRAEGKALRAATPLDAHAEVPDVSGRDAVEVLRAQDVDREQSLLPLRYQRTSADAFAFLRGSAAVMAGDLATVPRTTALVQLCGDAHVANFGLFASPDRRLMFDVNDFDETLRGPFEWDVKRLAASVAVAARTIGMRDKRARRAARRAVESYRNAMASLAEAPTLDLWYLRLDADDLTRRLVGTALERAAAKAGKKARRNTGDVAVDRMTTVSDGVRVFRADPPVLSPIASDEVEAQIGALYAHYLDTLPIDCALLLARYSFRGAAHRVVGVGSVGTRCLLMLLESGDGEPLLLQLKQAGPSALESHLGASRFGSAHGRRVVAGQRLMQAAGDPFLGWADAGRTLEHDYYARQLRDMKGSIDAARLDEEALDLYGRVCGGVLARAHARAGDASLVSGYLGSSDTFDVAVAEFALAYADITESDHAALVSARAEGRIPVDG
jgi:uncharacterized protein (DUF2252 family)